MKGQFMAGLRFYKIRFYKIQHNSIQHNCVYVVVYVCRNACVWVFYLVETKACPVYTFLWVSPKLKIVMHNLSFFSIIQIRVYVVFLQYYSFVDYLSRIELISRNAP